MVNVPDNFGIKVDEIKLHDKEKIEDYIKLIKVLQDDNLKLEKERATLKQTLKMQAVMTKNENPKERYKNLNLSGEQQLKLDQYALNLMNGELEIDQGDVYSLRRENESLKADLEVLKQKNFDTIAH